MPLLTLLCLLWLSYVILWHLQVGKQLSLGDIGGGSCSLFHKAFPEFAAREHQWPLI